METRRNCATLPTDKKSPPTTPTARSLLETVSKSEILVRVSFISSAKDKLYQLLKQVALYGPFNKGDAVLKMLRAECCRRFQVNREPRREEVETTTLMKDTDRLNITTKGSGCVADNQPENKCEWDVGWTVADDLLVYRTERDRPSTKVAGFDMDNTLICDCPSDSPTDQSQWWTVAMPEIAERLKRLKLDGYRLVIFTNQIGLSSGAQNVAVLRSKIEQVVRRLDSVTICMVSPRSGFNRKPLPGMWHQLELHDGDPVRTDRNRSFYVGDAAGRRHDTVGRRTGDDHSCCDRLFAINLGVRFLTPEEFFLGQSPMVYRLPCFDPGSVSTSSTLLDPSTASLTPTTRPELIVLIGCPASGKSHFARTHLRAYSYVGRDSSESMQNCLTVVGQLLKGNCSVVVEHRKPGKRSRSPYANLAKRNDIRARCFLMNCGFDQARHNNKYRRLLSVDEARKPIGDASINTYRSRFQEPTLDEGFDEIVRVNFQPNFVDKRSENIYRMYLLEK